MTTALFKPSKNPNLPSLEKYCMYLVTEADLEEEVLVMAGVLFSRFLKGIGSNTTINYHKLLATVIFVAQKYALDMEIWGLTDFGVMAGLTAKSLSKLEICYLLESKFNFYVGTSEF